MIVPDALIVAAFIFPKDELHETAKRVSRRDADWHCPELVLSEVRSVALKQRKHASLETIIAHCNLVPAAVSLYRLDATAVLFAADEGNIWAYDAEYVALARKLQCRLVTIDPDVLKGFPAVAMRPEEFLDS